MSLEKSLKVRSVCWRRFVVNVTYGSTITHKSRSAVSSTTRSSSHRALMLISLSYVTFSISSLRFSMKSIHSANQIPAGSVSVDCLRKPLRFTTKREGTNFEFVEVEKANIDSNSGEVYFITFVAKDPLDKKTKVFQAKVIHVFCREIVHSFCRLKPNQPESIAKKAPISSKKKRKHRLKIKPGCINSNLKGDGLGLGDKQAAQPKSKEQRSSEATYENRAEGDEYKQRMMSELANRFFALASFDLS
ncbi:uncharacterized protein LOC106369628 [Brassica napus]|uniref:uncharacterized protein LOC106369628 n=1 Tax=Brassica napus TaxID=3708 RepID=UPI0020787AF8|nr:uncharacterized protein LOC106369628 [Brassica napus]